MSAASATDFPKAWPRSTTRLRATPTAAAIQDGRKAAMISFDVTADGIRPVPRPHSQLDRGGTCNFAGKRAAQGANIMSVFAPTSFAGLVSSLAVWLLTGGTFALHHPFDIEALETQINEQGATH